MTQLQFFYDIHPIQITGFPFLFLFLPLFLLVYYLVPRQWRPPVLLAQSLLFYAGSEGRLVLLMALSLLADYGALRLMERFDDNARLRKGCLVFCLLKNLGLIAWRGAAVQIFEVIPILGLQIYALCAIGMALSTYRREIPYERNLVRFGLYCCFYPKLYAGPLLPYENFVCQLDDLSLRPGAVVQGLGQYIQGAFKISVFGSALFALWQRAAGLPEVTALAAWVQVFACAFALYFLLSGFNDIAQGLGAAYGFSLPRNFYYPFQSRSVEDFFDRFNITVGQFIRSTVYKGLQENRNGVLADALNLSVVAMLSGLWFGLRINYLLWGLYFAMFIVMERYLYPRLLEAVPRLFCRIGTLCVILAGFTIFAADSPLQSLRLIRSMFHFGNPFDEQILYLLGANWLLLLLSCLFATNLVNLCAVKFRRKAPIAAAIVLGGVDLVILLLYVALSL